MKFEKRNFLKSFSFSKPSFIWLWSPKLLIFEKDVWKEIVNVFILFFYHFDITKKDRKQWTPFPLKMKSLHNFLLIISNDWSKIKYYITHWNTPRTFWSNIFISLNFTKDMAIILYCMYSNLKLIIEKNSLDSIRIVHTEILLPLVIWQEFSKFQCTLSEKFLPWLYIKVYYSTNHKS